MAERKGAARLRQAIENQAAAGEACFSLPVAEARVVCDECEDELARLSWAQGVPAPVDADGEVVPLTTRVMYDRDGVKHMVHSFTFVKEHNRWAARCVQLRANSPVIHRPYLLHLTCPDSWERLGKDAELAPRDYLQSRGMDPEKTERVKAMMADLVSRAKALAERDAKDADRD